MNVIEQSKCVYEAILADVVQTYDRIGGGGISSIRQTATYAYTVSIAQEGQTDLIKYVVEIDEDGAVTILSRETSVKTR